jgi:lipopolysaccharide biosynthesis glycosyltransferase
MIELVLTINDKDGSYTRHAAVVLASIFSNTQHKVNVHIVHDESLSKENMLRLTQLVQVYHNNIYFYHVTLPEDFLEVAAGVHKIEYWTKASMYRLLLPQFIQTDKVIYLDCDVFVNMDINELWSIDLGEHYLGAVLDQGMDLFEYFANFGFSAETYFNSGVIVFQLNNIRNKQTWYLEMLDFLRRFPFVTMPDQDVLNALYGANYLQLDNRYNTFVNSEHNLEHKIAHFAGDNKSCDANSPAAPIYNQFLAMTPWSETFIPELIVRPIQADFTPEPNEEIQHEEQPLSDHIIPVKRHRQKRRRTSRLRPRKKRMTRTRSSSVKQVKPLKPSYAKKKKLGRKKSSNTKVFRKKSTNDVSRTYRRVI